MPKPRITDEVILKAALVYTANAGSLDKVQKAFNIAQPTATRWLRAAKDKYPELFGDFQANKNWTGNDMRLLGECFEAYRNNGYDQNRAALALGLPVRTVRGRLEDFRSKTGVSTEPDIAEAGFKRASDDSSNAMRARIKDLHRESNKLREELDTLRRFSRSSIEPAEWSLRIHDNKPREHLPYLISSDFHVGEVVDKRVTEAGYGYNSAIFRKRYRRLIDTTIYLALQHSGNWTYPGFIYARGGDTISGSLHDDSVETNDATPRQAIEIAFEEEAAGIKKLAEAFGKVEIKVFGASGNHDRDTKKIYSKNAMAHSWDALVTFMLKREFASDKRINIQSSDSFDVRFRIYKRSILLTHGHLVGSRGGQGFVGPAATILRGVQRVMLEQSRLGFHVDRVDLGHWHYPLLLPHAIANGSLVGYSEFGKSFRADPNPPTQILVFHHPKWGEVDYRPIQLQEDA